jgi:hypothetical protein
MGSWMRKGLQHLRFYRIKNKLFSIVLIILIITSSILITLLTSEKTVTGSFTGEDATPPSAGNWVIDSPGNVVINEIIILNGSLIIQNSGSLTFKNVTLLMNCPVNGTYNIDVETGGEFLIYDLDNDPLTINDSSKITSATPDGRHRFYFHVKKDASFEMKNSELHECGYFLDEVPAPYWMTGLCIEASNSLIENCIISNNNYGLLLLLLRHLQIVLYGFKAI